MSAFTNFRALLLGLCCALHLITQASADGQVWIVDDTPGQDVDFAHPEPAVAAAAEGDTILVRAGIYYFGPGITISKGLAIYGEPGALFMWDSGWDSNTGAALNIFDLSDEQEVVVRGIHFSSFGQSPSNSYPNANLQVKNCTGSVLLQDCSFNFSMGIGFLGSAVIVKNCDRVSFINCHLQGHNAWYVDHYPWYNSSYDRPSPALTVVESRLSLYSCTLQGGRGVNAIADYQDCLSMSATHGSPALNAEESELVIVGCELYGGAGGNGECDPCWCMSGGAGGAGLSLSSSQALVVDSFFQGGVGGAHAGGGQADAGPPVAGPGADFIPGEARGLTTPAQHTAGTDLPLTVEGLPGEIVVLLSAHRAGFTPLPAYGGVLLLGDSASVVHIARMGADGQLHLVLPTEDLGAGSESALLYLQAGLLRPAGVTPDADHLWRTLSPASAVLLTAPPAP